MASGETRVAGLKWLDFARASRPPHLWMGNAPAERAAGSRVNPQSCGVLTLGNLLVSLGLINPNGAHQTVQQMLDGLMNQIEGGEVDLSKIERALPALEALGLDPDKVLSSLQAGNADYLLGKNDQGVPSCSSATTIVVAAALQGCRVESVKLESAQDRRQMEQCLAAGGRVVLRYPPEQPIEILGGPAKGPHVNLLQNGKDGLEVLDSNESEPIPLSNEQSSALVGKRPPLVAILVYPPKGGPQDDFRDL